MDHPGLGDSSAMRVRGHWCSASGGEGVGEEENLAGGPFVFLREPCRNGSQEQCDRSKRPLDEQPISLARSSWGPRCQQRQDGGKTLQNDLTPLYPLTVSRVGRGLELVSVEL